MKAPAATSAPTAADADQRKSGIAFEFPPRHLHLDLGIMVMQVAGSVIQVGA